MTTRLYEDENAQYDPDPDGVGTRHRQLVTQPYDLEIRSLIGRIKDGTLHVRPRFQRRYIWSNRLASDLIESILLNIPIPPCYLAQTEDFEHDVIDGQQRIYSIYRFVENQFKLANLEVMSELSGLYYHQLDRRIQKQITTHILRTVTITKESHPEIQFDVFERLNTKTRPLNAQELRNCVYRGGLNDLLGELALHEPWLNILGRKRPDDRFRDQEMILRFFAFHVMGLSSYRTPQKHWLNDLAEQGRKYSSKRLEDLASVWKNTINKCLLIFSPKECFRRLDDTRRRPVNRGLMDLTMTTLSNIPRERVIEKRDEFRQRYADLLRDDDFQELVSRSIDHKTRLTSRFDIWQRQVADKVFQDGTLY